MKNVFLTLVLVVIGTTTFAQDSTILDTTVFTIKDYSLRDYIAPDIRYKQFSIFTNAGGYGGQVGEGNYNSTNGNLRLLFSNYINVADYQGRSSSSIWTSFNGNWNVQDSTSRRSDINSSLSLRYASENRWYNENEWFIAIHPSASYRLDSRNNSYRYDTTTTTRIEDAQSLGATVFLSIGYGRIQPVTAARRAMDILISLEKYNRLSSIIDAAAVDSLAKIANRIAYKRFYDVRYKRVYQLEELDKGIQGMGLVTDPDMVYAANLSDIWGYGRTYGRGSGERVEVGVVPQIRYSDSKGNYYSNSEEQNTNSMGVLGFLSWNRLVPLSYEWQSDFFVDISAGFNKHNGYYNGNTYVSEKVDIVSEILNVRYSLGFYPNTRTFLALTPFASFAVNQTTAETFENESIGMNTGVSFRSYYYISPRFRMALDGGVKFVSDGYENQLHMPSNVITSYPSNIWINNSFDNNISGFNQFRYNYELTLSYAIF